MKNRLLIAMLSLVVASSCYREGKTARGDDDLGSTVPSATTTAVTGGGVSAMANADKDFVMKAAQAGLAEVSMGQLAMQKATHPDVIAFGNRMVTDHSKANDELMQLATLKGLALPSEPDQKQKDAAHHVSELRGKQFDTMYMTHMVEDHQKAVADFQNASQNAQDADLKSFAAKTLPTLQAHLQMATDVRAKLR
jgi:putative membrane protein